MSWPPAQYFTVTNIVPLGDKTMTSVAGREGVRAEEKREIEGLWWGRVVTLRLTHIRFIDHSPIRL